MARQLPPRQACSLAIRILEGYDDEDAQNHIDVDIEEDDVVYNINPDGNEDSDSSMVESEEVDELIDDAEDWIFHEDTTESENSDEEDSALGADETIIARDGTVWRTRAQPGG